MTPQFLNYQIQTKKSYKLDPSYPTSNNDNDDH